jgi:hypothetical protein
MDIQRQMSDNRPFAIERLPGTMLMDRPQSRLARSASALALFPILGLLGGILLGVIRAYIWRGDELMNLGLTVQSAVLGSLYGTAVAVIFAVLERKNLTSIKRMMAIILVVAVVIWAVVTVLRDLFGTRVL